MRNGNSYSKIAVTVILLLTAFAVISADNHERQLVNLLISEVGPEKTKELMELPKIKSEEFLLVSPNLRFCAVCTYYAGGDSIMVETIFDYRGKKK